VATHYDLNPDDAVLFERNAAVVDGEPGDELHFTQLRAYAERGAAVVTINRPAALVTLRIGRCRWSTATSERPGDQRLDKGRAPRLEFPVGLAELEFAIGCVTGFHR
jgi:hypothetical protein